MEKKKSLIVVSIIVIVAVAIGVIFIGGSSDQEKQVIEVFEAQMDSIKGDNSGLKKLDLVDEYGDFTDSFVSKTQFSPTQIKAVDVAKSNFTYKVVEVKTHENGSSTTYEIIYDVDAYPVVNSMSEYTNNPEKYLSAEQLELYKNGTSAEKVEMSKVLLDLYSENIEKIKPVRERHSVSYVISSSGDVEFALGNSSDDLIGSVLGMKSDYVVE